MNTSAPRHIAFIMDGNGRWARKRRLPSSAGHRAGAQALRKLAPEAEKMGVRYMTVYAFSTENWQRPQEEVEGLMYLLREYIQQYIDDSEKNEMRISVIGDINRLEKDLQRKIKDLTVLTERKRGLQVNIALNYGGRDEITRAARRLALRVRDEALSPGEIDETVFAAQLDTAGLPDPDLLIRTGGEMRISNFLLWQAAYTEIYVSPKLWPDFSARDLREAINWFGGRERRFGARV